MVHLPVKDISKSNILDKNNYIDTKIENNNKMKYIVTLYTCCYYYIQFVCHYSSFYLN